MSKVLLFLILIILPSAGFSQNKAVSDISTQFKHLGLIPKGENNSYSQIIVHKAGKDFHKGTFLIINGNTLETGKDFVPLAYSANDSAAGNPLIAVQERKMPWIINLNNFTISNSGQSPALYKIAQQAIQNKATALLFYNSGDNEPNPGFDLKDDHSPLSIPAVFVRKSASQNYFKDPTASVTVQLKVNIYETSDTAYNLLGYLDNHAASSLLISTRYDHEDDVAILLKLVKLLKNDKHFRHANYLFIAFSPKEKEIQPVKFFAEHPAVDLNKAACLINLNKTGQLNPDTRNLYIKGYGSSSLLASILQKVRSKYLALQFEPAKLDSSALTVFYEKNIPVISLSTEKDSYSGGMADSTEMISKEGEGEILKYLSDVIERLNRELR